MQRIHIRLGGHAPRLVIFTMVALIVALAALVFLAEAGYRERAGIAERVSQVRDRQMQVSRVVLALTEGESAMRGFLISGNPVFVRSVEEARARAATILASLQAGRLKGRTADNAQLAELRRLIEQRFAQFDRRIELYRVDGLEAVRSSAIPSNEGQRTMSDLRGKLRELEAEESDELIAALGEWLRHLRRERWAMAALSVFGAILVLIAGTLVYRQLRRGASETSALQERVRLGLSELEALSSHLQHVSEGEKKALARELHDALGGLLVATKMDVAWIRNHLERLDPAIELRFARIQKSLDQGVDFKRRVVEQLRPTLLDNMGLFAALRWQFQDMCNRASLKCIEDLPDQELVLTSDAAIGLFRVAQEAVTNMLKHARASAAWLKVEIQGADLMMVIADNGRGIPSHAGTGGGQGLASMRHRITALGGELQIRPWPQGGTEVVVRVPLARVLAEPAVDEGAAAGSPAAAGQLG